MNNIHYEFARAQMRTIIENVVADRKADTRECVKLVAMLRKGAQIVGLYPQFTDLNVATAALTDPMVMPDYWMVRVEAKGERKYFAPLHINQDGQLIAKRPAHIKIQDVIPYGIAPIVDGAEAILVEGWGKVDELASIGIFGITSGSAGSFAGANWRLLKDKNISLVGFPDHDEAGFKYINQVYLRHRFEWCIDVSHLAEKGDVVDWIRAFEQENHRAPSKEDFERAFARIPFEPSEGVEAELGDWPTLAELHDLAQVSIDLSAIPDYRSGLPALCLQIIEDVRIIVQCDELLAFSSLLGLISGISSHIADIVRNNYKSGPITIYIVVLAASGERKTGAEAILYKEFHRCSDELQEKYEKALSEYKSKLKVFDKIGSGILRELEENHSAGLQYEEHQKNPPQPPIRNIIRIPANSSTQFLTYQLGEVYPITFLSSAEGGIYFGNFANSSAESSATQTTLNGVWDGISEGGAYKTENKSSRRVRCRHTMCLAVQPPQFGRWLWSEEGGGQASGNGALARVLLCMPPSMIGGRTEDRSPKGAGQNVDDLPSLAMLYRITRKLMMTPAIVNRAGITPLTQIDIRDNPEAHTIFCDFADEIERASKKPTGRYCHHTDMSSKCAEQALRIASNLAIFNRVHQLILENDQNDVSAMASVSDKLSSAIYEDVPLTQAELQSIVIGPAEISCAINLARYFLTETIRLIEGLGQVVQGEDAKAVLSEALRFSNEKGLEGRVPRRFFSQFSSHRWMRNANGWKRIERLIEHELDGYLRLEKARKGGDLILINPNILQNADLFGA